MMKSMQQRAKGLIQGTDQKYRCYWCMGSQLYQDYHDQEWGVVPQTDQEVFRNFSLEILQAGLSWLTILKKRPALDQYFCDFDFYRLQNFTEADVTQLLNHREIIRHRGKIQAIIHNACCAVEMVSEMGSLKQWFWTFAPYSHKQLVDFDFLQNKEKSECAFPLMQALKQKGWKFVGREITYAFMQANGMVNDHIDGCFCKPIGL